MSDHVHISQICYGKWLAEASAGNLDRIRHDQGWKAEGGFSVTNLGNLGRIGAEGTHAPAGRSHVAEGHSWGPKAPQLAKRACPPRRGLEGEPHSGSNF